MVCMFLNSVNVCGMETTQAARVAISFLAARVVGRIVHSDSNGRGAFELILYQEAVRLLLQARSM